MNPEDLLQAISEKYALLDSYQDEGVVFTYDPVKPGPGQIHFATLFRRPDLFRFEWTSHHPYPPLRHIINQQVVGFDGSSAYYHSSRNGDVKAVENLAMAVGMATGVSSGSALTVSCLLSDQIEVNSTVLDIKETLLLEEEEFEGVICHHLAGHDPWWAAPMELWIGRDDFLLRKVTERRDNPVFSEEIRRNVRVGEVIPLDAFQFRSPSFSV